MLYLLKECQKQNQYLNFEAFSFNNQKSYSHLKMTILVTSKFWLQIWGISSMCGSLFAFKSVNFLQASFKAQFNLFSHVNLNMYNNKYLYTIGLPKSSNYHQSLFLNRFLRFYQKKFFWQIYPIVMKLIVFVYKKIA